MAFRFTLEKVLGHRRRMVDLCSREVAVKAADLARIDGEIAATRERQRSAADEGAAFSDAVVRRRCAYWISHLETKLEELAGTRYEAVALWEEAREKLLAAWRKREVLEQLRRRRLDEWRAEQERLERRELDEIGRLMTADRRQECLAGHRE